MVVIQDQDNRISIKILETEFTEPQFIEDLEWLIINISVSDEYHDWSTSGPFLRKKEIIDLIAWFEQSSEEEIINNHRIEFAENELSFEYKNQILIVYFDFDAHPKGKSYDYEKDREYRVDLKLTKNQMYTGSKNLKSELDPFILNRD